MYGPQQNVEIRRHGKKNFWLLAFHGPTVGAINAESPKRTFSTKKERRINWSRKRCFFLKICTISCMSEAVTISNGSRILPAPLGPLNALKTKICFLAFTPQFLFIFLERPWGYRSLVPPRGHHSCLELKRTEPTWCVCHMRSKNSRCGGVRVARRSRM